MAATDIFFVIESVNVFMEKLLELFDEPVLAYAKTEWLKYKEILTSAEFSPLKCFSYSNAVTITKPFVPILVAPANVPVANLQLHELDTSFQRSKVDSRDEKHDSIHLGPWSLANLGSAQNLTSTTHKSKEQGNNNSNSNNNNNNSSSNNTSSSSNTFDYSQQYIPQSQPIPMQSSTSFQSHLLHGQQSSHPSISQPSIPQLQFTASNIVFNVKQENNLHSHNYNNNNININSTHTTNMHSSNNTPLGYQITPTYQHFTPGMGTPQSKDTQKILQNLTSGSVSSTTSSYKPTIEKERHKSPSMVQITSNTSLQRLQPSKSISTVIAGTPATPGNKAGFAKLKAASPPQSSIKKLVPSALGRSPAGITAATAHMKAQKSLQIDIKENTLSQRITSNPGNNHHSSRSSSASSRIPNSSNSATFYNSIGAHKPAQPQQSVTENIQNPNLNQVNVNSKNQSISSLPQGVRNSISNLAISGNVNLSNSGGSSANQTQRMTTAAPGGGQLGLKSSKSLNQTPLIASMNVGRSQLVPPLLLTPSMTMYNPSSFGTQSAALSQRSQVGGASVITESMNIDNMIKSQNQGYSYASAGAAQANFPAYPQNSIYNSTNNRLINIKTEKSTIIENSPKNSKIEENINKVNNQALEPTANMPQSSEGTANRRKGRRETRKLSLEKYQLNIDAINKQNDQDNNQSDDINQDSPSLRPKNKGFLQVMMNQFDNGINSQEKKRDTSPVNKRICSEKIQDFSAFNEISSVAKKVENPFKNLIASMRQRINHFKMDTLTLQLVVGKQKVFEDTPTNRNTEPAALSFENAEEAPQERAQVKRGNLKRFSVFAKKDNVNSTSKRVDEQITQAEQQSQLLQKDRKQNGGNKKNRDDKKKIIF